MDDMTVSRRAPMISGTKFPFAVSVTHGSWVVEIKNLIGTPDDPSTPRRFLKASTKGVP